MLELRGGGGTGFGGASPLQAAGDARLCIDGPCYSTSRV
jgi:hypothetical protein